MALPTIVFAPDVLELFQRITNEREPRTHDDAVGGLLIGKRDGDRLLIVGAIEPGPNAHDQRMGFGLDVDHVNTALPQWFARDPDVDIVGVWHTHPRDLVEPTLDDVAAAYALREDGGQDVVSALAIAGVSSASIQCFFLEATNAQRVGLAPVPYTVEPIALAPFPAVAPVAAIPAMPPTTPVAAEPAGTPATPRRTTTARIYDRGVEPVVPTQSGTTWTSDETDLVLPPAVAGSPALPRPRLLTSVVYGVIALLVVLGLWYLFSGRGGGGANDAVPTSTAASVAGAAETSAPAPSATVEPPAVAPTDTVAPTGTAAPSPTRAPTATRAPTEAAQTTTALPLDATVEASAEATAAADATALPYVLQWQPMPAAQRTAFLARARANNCADCYNVDLIPPDPYQELRVEIDGGPAALNTFEVPSLGYVAPRAAPHTLQVFDAEGEAVSPPVEVVAAPNRYYILSILAP
jgi:integrative and conjugative element protein (TIGR02256 family)